MYILYISTKKLNFKSRIEIHILSISAQKKFKFP